MRRTRWILAAIIAVAVLARGYSAIHVPLEQDELYTMDEATNLFHTHLLPGIQARPIFFLLAHPLAVASPDSPLPIRGLALLFGIAGLWALWRLARSVLGTEASIVALLLVALSPWQLYASGFARYYSLLFLLAALVYWLLPRAYDSDTRRDYLTALIPLALGAWTHPSFIFPVIGAALGVTLIRKDGAVTWRWPSRNAWLCLWGPLLAVSLAGIVAIQLLRSGTSVANGSGRSLAAIIRLIPAMADWATPTVSVVGAMGALLLLGSRVPGRRRFGAMALLGSATTVVALFALSFRTAIYADYGLAALPLVLVAAAGAVQWVLETVVVDRRGVVAVALSVILAVGVLPSFISHLSDGTRFDYRPAYAAIEREAPSLPVLTWPLILQRHYAPQLQGSELPRSRAKLDSLLARDGDLWAVVSVKRYGIVGDDTGEMRTWFSNNCHQIDQYQRPRLDYRVYRVELWRCTEES